MLLGSTVNLLNKKLRSQAAQVLESKQMDQSQLEANLVITLIEEQTGKELDLSDQEFNQLQSMISQISTQDMEDLKKVLLEDAYHQVDNPQVQELENFLTQHLQTSGDLQEQKGGVEADDPVIVSPEFSRDLISAKRVADDYQDPESEEFVRDYINDHVLNYNPRDKDERLNKQMGAGNSDIQEAFRVMTGGRFDY